jgi:hypothetical protein
MVSFKGLVSCAIALLFTTALYAEEKAATQVATTQVAAVTKTQASSDANTAAANKNDDATPAGCAMKNGCMPCAMCSKMVASGNGGVIILTGNRLLKYDANLNLVKEIEIKPAAEPVKKAEKAKAPEAKPADAKK